MQALKLSARQEKLLREILRIADDNSHKIVPFREVDAIRQETNFGTALEFDQTIEFFAQSGLIWRNELIDHSCGDIVPSFLAVTYFDAKHVSVEESRKREARERRRWLATFTLSGLTLLISAALMLQQLGLIPRYTAEGWSASFLTPHVVHQTVPYTDVPPGDLSTDTGTGV